MGIISAVAGLGSAILGYSSARKQAKAQQQAAQTAAEQAQQGFHYAEGNPNIAQAQTQGQQAGDIRAGILGLGNAAQGEAGLQHYLNSVDFNFTKNEGMGAVTGSQAASGLLNSGATLKALQARGQDLARTAVGGYLDQLGGVQNTGLNSAFNVANLASGAGARSGADIMTGQNNAAKLIGQGNDDLVIGLGTAGGGFADYTRMTNPAAYVKYGGYLGPPGTKDALTGYVVPTRTSYATAA